jgi:hypothetical protein
MANYYLDFVGLNTFIYEPVGFDPNNQTTVLRGAASEKSTQTAGNVHFFVEQNSFGGSIHGLGTTQSWVLSNAKNYRFSHNLPNTASFFPALMLHRNGPYGFPTWKQIRVGQNPLTRRQIKENIFTHVKEPGSPIVIEGSNLNQRFGNIESYVEVPVVSRFKPLTVHGGESGVRVEIKTSMGNNICHFNNQNLDKYYGFSGCENKDYKEIRKLYADGGLENSSTPLDEFVKFVYSETIYPTQIYSNKSYTRQRTTFSFNWRDSLANRTEESVDNNFGTTISKQSIWPLDYDTTQGESGGNHRYGNYYGFDHDDFANGILQNNYSFWGDLFADGPKHVVTINSVLKPAPIYARKHSLTPSASVVAQSGMIIEGLSNGTGSALNHTCSIPSGEAKWEAPDQSGKSPFYDSYDDFIQGARQRAKGYTIVPEFRISNHIPALLAEGIDKKFSDMFEMVGGLSTAKTSDDNDFYKIYSTSEFLKHFDVIKEDHKGFVDPVKIKIRCKAVKKFLPYDGFYPCQRTVSLAEQFYSSYSPGVTIEANSTGFFSSYFPASTVAFGHQNLLTPLFAPGVLFNSIKSGIACDYPLVTDNFIDVDNGTAYKAELGMVTSSQLGYDYFVSEGHGTTNTIFDRRIPFRALVEPERFLSQIQLHNQEPHPSSSNSVHALWDGSGDPLYKMMAHNFLAEVPEFFLRDKRFTAIYSKASNSPNVGHAEEGVTYSMRVRMYKTSDNAITPSISSSADDTDYFFAPQFTGAQKENFTMYSRPTAFGPPTCLTASGYGGKLTGSNSNVGENYPFTPPYYYGQAWADIKFKASTSKQFTIDEIIKDSDVSYWRYVHEDSGGGNYDQDHRARRINTMYNNNAMQLSASVDLFARGKVEKVDLVNKSTLDSLSVAVDISSNNESRWIIQPFFETPMLNFNHLSASDSLHLPSYGWESVPRGMWHQYGRIETDPSKGIFLQVTDIPLDFRKKVSGSVNEKSLKELCGFPDEPRKLGQIASTKVIREAVVAIPFIEEDAERKFFNIDRETIDIALMSGEVSRADGATVGRTIVDMVKKMQRFVIPPSLDFVHRSDLQPFAMYIFEFTHRLSQQDLSDIWQNLCPSIGRSFEESEASISHNLLAHELIGGGKLFMKDKELKAAEMPDRIKWMVFKAKQRAKTNYNEKLAGSFDSEARSQELSTNLFRPDGFSVDISYNWPYDFFSLVELVKLDAEVVLADTEIMRKESDEIVPITRENLTNVTDFGPSVGVNPLVFDPVPPETVTTTEQAEPEAIGSLKSKSFNALQKTLTDFSNLQMDMQTMTQGAAPGMGPVDVQQAAMDILQGGFLPDQPTADEFNQVVQEIQHSVMSGQLNIANMQQLTQLISSMISNLRNF